MKRWLFIAATLTSVAWAQAPAPAVISVQGVARVDSPVWIQIELPRPFVVFYPVMYVPWVFWCDEFEVRRNGKLIPQIDLPKLPLVYFGAFGCPGSNADFNGHPPPFSNRLPLHLQYHFTEPGIYEVRYSRYGDGSATSRQVRFQSAWTQFDILAAEPHEISAPPDSPENLRRDFLPNLLADRSDEALALLVTFHYHSDSQVREYAAAALNYWSASAVENQLIEALSTRGPTPVVAKRLASRASEFVDTALPYLASDSPLILQGAVEIASRALSESSTLSPEQRSRIELSLASAIDRFEDFDTSTAQGLIQPLGYANSARVHEALWSLVDRHVAAGQALVEIAAHPNPQDLSRITAYMLARLPKDWAEDGTAHLIHMYFPDAALPSLRTAVNQARSPKVRIECAEELILANDPSGFAFALDAIEHDRSWKSRTIQMLGRFVDTRTYSESQLIRYLTDRAAARPQQQ